MLHSGSLPSPVRGISYPLRSTIGTLVLASLLIVNAFGCGSSRVVSSEDPRIDAFVGEVVRMLEEHRWRDLLAVVDPENYETQVEHFGIGEPQYVAELFYLNNVGNGLLAEERIEWSDLERIGRVELHSISLISGRYVVEGVVDVKGGEEMRLEFSVERRNDGTIYLTGGVG